MIGSCNPSTPFAESCLDIESQVIATSDSTDETIVDSEVLAAIRNEFQFGTALTEAFPEVASVSYLPRSTDPPTPTREVSSGGLPAAITASISVVAAALIGVCAFFGFRKYQDTKKQQDFDPNEGENVDVDSVEKAEGQGDGESSLPFVESQNEEERDEETYENTSHTSRQQEGSSQAHENITTFEDDEADSHNDNEKFEKETRDSAVAMLVDDEGSSADGLLVTEDRITGNLILASSKSIGSEITNPAEIESAGESNADEESEHEDIFSAVKNMFEEAEHEAEIAAERAAEPGAEDDTSVDQEMAVHSEVDQDSIDSFVSFTWLFAEESFERFVKIFDIMEDDTANMGTEFYETKHRDMYADDESMSSFQYKQPDIDIMEEDSGNLGAGYYDEQNRDVYGDEESLDDIFGVAAADVDASEGNGELVLHQDKKDTADDAEAPVPSEPPGETIQEASAMVVREENEGGVVVQEAGQALAVATENDEHVATRSSSNSEPSDQVDAIQGAVKSEIASEHQDSEVSAEESIAVSDAEEFNDTGSSLPHEQETAFLDGGAFNSQRFDDDVTDNSFNDNMERSSSGSEATSSESGESGDHGPPTEIDFSQCEEFKSSIGDNDSFLSSLENRAIDSQDNRGKNADSKEKESAESDHTEECFAGVHRGNSILSEHSGEHISFHSRSDIHDESSIHKDGESRRQDEDSSFQSGSYPSDNVSASRDMSQEGDEGSFQSGSRFDGEDHIFNKEEGDFTGNDGNSVHEYGEHEQGSEHSLNGREDVSHHRNDDGSFHSRGDIEGDPSAHSDGESYVERENEEEAVESGSRMDDQASFHSDDRSAEESYTGNEEGTFRSGSKLDKEIHSMDSQARSFVDEEGSFQDGNEQLGGTDEHENCSPLEDGDGSNHSRGNIEGDPSVHSDGESYRDEGEEASVHSGSHVEDQASFHSDVRSNHMSNGEDDERSVQSGSHFEGEDPSVDSQEIRFNAGDPASFQGSVEHHDQTVEAEFSDNEYSSPREEDDDGSIHSRNDSVDELSLHGDEVASFQSGENLEDHESFHSHDTSDSRSYHDNNDQPIADEVRSVGSQAKSVEGDEGFSEGNCGHYEQGSGGSVADEAVSHHEEEDRSIFSGSNNSHIASQTDDRVSGGSGEDGSDYDAEKRTGYDEGNAIEDEDRSIDENIEDHERSPDAIEGENEMGSYDEESRSFQSGNQLEDTSYGDNGSWHSAGQDDHGPRSHGDENGSLDSGNDHSFDGESHNGDGSSFGGGSYLEEQGSENSRDFSHHEDHLDGYDDEGARSFNSEIHSSHDSMPDFPVHNEDAAQFSEHSGRDYGSHHEGSYHSRSQDDYHSHISEHDNNEQSMSDHGSYQSDEHRSFGGGASYSGSARHDGGSYHEDDRSCHDNMSANSQSIENQSFRGGSVHSQSERSSEETSNSGPSVNIDYRLE